MLGPFSLWQGFIVVFVLIPFGAIVVIVLVSVARGMILGAIFVFKSVVGKKRSVIVLVSVTISMPLVMA